MDGFLPMDDDSAAARARRFREKAEEIRRAARLANSLDIVRELLETAFHFDNMAARVEKRFEPVKVYTGSPMTSRECGDS
ncbi:MAG TPA: hypothetical protein VHT52_22300, partial [Stellaceae bacterium]|nr:hypothetical protein [Stellaceae bacterium]